METLPDRCILQYIVKKTKKNSPSWQDINELTHAHEKMMLEQFETGDPFDYFKKAFDRIRSNHERIGVMVSFVHPEYPDTIAIGYSLCNSNAKDKFDYQLYNYPNTYIKAEGFGKHIAVGRAISWGDPNSRQDKSGMTTDWSKTDIEASKNYLVPPSIKVQFLKFIDRSKRYYKDKNLPEWVLDYLSDC